MTPDVRTACAGSGATAAANCGWAKSLPGQCLSVGSPMMLPGSSCSPPKAALAASSLRRRLRSRWGRRTCSGRRPRKPTLPGCSRQDPAPELGFSAAWEVVAAVTEGLVSVGAMSAHSPLLPPLLGRHKRSSHPDLPRTWPQPVRLGTAPDFQIALCVPLPFEHAAAVIEGISAWGEDIQLHIYGWPWIQGQRWPAQIPSFKVRAIDDVGQEYEGMAGTWRGYGAGEGHCDVTLWPSVPRRAARVRVVISTLWEARWADIKLPSR